MSQQKAKPVISAKKRRQFKGPSLPTRYGATVQQSNGPQSIGIGGGGGQYGGQRFANPSEEYLTLVVQRWSGEWSYVRVNQHCLDVIASPCVFTRAEAEDLLEIWKRVVIDNAIPWEDSVRPDTLRIVKYKLNIEDETLSLFGSDDAVKNFLRMSAMAKLSDAEARLLGLTTLKAKQKITHDPQFCREDKVVLNRLMQESATLALSPNLDS